MRTRFFAKCGGVPHAFAGFSDRNYKKHCLGHGFVSFYLAATRRRFHAILTSVGSGNIALEQIWTLKHKKDQARRGHLNSLAL